MRLRARCIVLTVVLAGSLVAPATVLAHEGHKPTTAVEEAGATLADEGAGSDNMDFITNVEFDTSRYPEASFNATDLDFASFRVGRNRTVMPPGASGGQVRDFAFVGTALNGLQVVDITDREAPEVVAVYDCAVSQADVFVFEQAERTLLAYSLDAVGQNDPTSQCHEDTRAYGSQSVRGSEFSWLPVLAGTTERGTFIIDVSDPYRPEAVSFLPMRKGTHQVTVHPSGNFVYNSAAVVVTGRPGSIEVYDISTPEEPVRTAELELLTGLDSHDLTFNDDGTRAYSAALTHSFVIDTEDPADPRIVGRIYDPAINIHHDAHKVTVDTPTGERDYMLIGDELAGAIGTGVCPGGGVHVYDITGALEQTPVKVGAFFIPEVRPAVDDDFPTTCTAHVLDILPEQELISIAWYHAGVRVLDYSGLADLGPAGASVGAGGETLTPGIQEVGFYSFPDSLLWSAKVPEVTDDGSFYVYGGDINRHLDVFRFDAGVDADTDPGEWLTPEEALEKSLSETADRHGISDDWKDALPDLR